MGSILPSLKTPMLDQARDIDSREDQRATLDQARFITRADVKQSSTTGVAEDTLQAAGDDLDISIRKGLDPKPHHFELRRK